MLALPVNVATIGRVVNIGWATVIRHRKFKNSWHEAWLLWSPEQSNSESESLCELYTNELSRLCKRNFLGFRLFCHCTTWLAIDRICYSTWTHSVTWPLAQILPVNLRKNNILKFQQQEWEIGLPWSVSWLHYWNITMLHKWVSTWWGGDLSLNICVMQGKSIELLSHFT